MYGFFRLKHNVYFNLVHGWAGWIRPVSFEERVGLYQRAKIGVNIHWDEFGLGNQRLYHLPANGVMQLSDCAESMAQVFEVGREVVTYKTSEELIAKIRYYLEHDAERIAVAAAGYRRVMRSYTFRKVMELAGGQIEKGMRRISWRRAGM